MPGVGIPGTVLVTADGAARIDSRNLPLGRHEASLEDLRFHDLAEALPQLVWAADAVGVKTYANRRYLDYLGAETVEDVDRMWKEAIHPEDLDRTVTNWRRSLETGEPYLSDYQMCNREGIYRYHLARAVPVKNESGEIVQWLGTVTDIHEQKMAEVLLRRSEKLATAGRLAASIAHEMNNPLAAVSNILYLLGEDKSLSASAQSYLKLAEQELSRATHFTTQTLRFHGQSKAPAAADLGKLIDSVYSVFRPRFEALSVSVSREYRTHTKLFCYTDEMRQAIASILSNSLDAMRKNGRLRIRVRHSRAMESGGLSGIRVVIADTGAGIPKNITNRIFEAFFTTKDATGTGLGLWVTSDIVRKHSGSIRLRSTTHGTRHGTVVSIFLPFTGVTDE
jgi:PAS domain S-box-containing protein